MPYSMDSHMLFFWQTKVEPIFKKLWNDIYPLPEVQMRHKELTNEILARYGQAIHVDLSGGPAQDTTDRGLLSSGSRVYLGRPEIIIIIPAIREIFSLIQKKHLFNFRQVFETDLVIGHLHELDHLALGVCHPPKNIQEVIDGETLVWAHTCEKTIRLFSEVYGRQLDESSNRYYSHWVAGGRNVESPSWKEYISGLYSSLRPSGY